MMNTAEQGVATGAAVTMSGTETRMEAFEGFLKKAGHVANVLLSEVLKYAIPISSLVGLLVPQTAPADAAFAASVTLVRNAVVLVQQRWSSLGSTANPQKLADVLELVEQPVITLFSQAGFTVDASYVTNLINGVVAMLNAQPGSALPAAAAKP